MKKIITKFLVVIACIASLTSCSDKGLKQAEIIPKDASAVFVIDQKAMKEKLKTGNYDMDSLINNLIKNSDSSNGKKLLEDWNNSGVDKNGKLIFFVYEDKKNASALNTSANFCFALDDDKKFETFLKNQKGLKTEELKKANNFSYIKMDDQLIISWNEKTALLTVNTSAIHSRFNPMAGRYREEARENEKAIKMIERFYNLKKEDKIESVQAFNDMFKKTADAYIFTSMSGLANRLKSLPIQVLKLEELLSDNYTIGYLTFENGKIVGETTTYYNPKITSILNQYGNSSVKISMIENFPATTTNGAALFSFKPEMLEGFMKELQVDGFIESALQSTKSGFTFKDITKCLKGDFGLAVGDFENTFAYKDYNENIGVVKNKGNKMIPMKVLFNAEVGDFTSLTKILQKAVEEKALINTNGVYTANADMMKFIPFYLRIDNKNVFIADSEDTYNKFIAKATKANFSKSFTNNLSGKNSLMYLNIGSLLSQFAQTNFGGVHGKNIMDKALATFDEVTVSSDNCKDGKAFGRGELKLKNDKENSLVSIAGFMKTVITEVQAIEKEEPKMEDVDLEMSKEKLDSLKKVMENL